MIRQNRLFVGHLHYSVSREQLERLFGDYGTVNRIDILDDRGFGYVEMSDRLEAEAAMNALNGYPLAGRNLRIERAREDMRSRRNHPGRMLF